MHREIINIPAGKITDHIDGDGLNNLRENLRVCTHQQNGFNRTRLQVNNKLKIKGVRWNVRNKKFEAQIRINNKAIYLGRFNVLGDADSVYRIAEEKYFGEFIRK